MDLCTSPARSPSSPARARASASRSTHALVGRRRARRRRRAQHREPREAGRRDRRRGRPGRAGRPGAARATRRSTTMGRVDVLVNNVGAVRLRLDGFLAHQRRGLRVGDEPELLRRPARDPGGARRRCSSRAAARSSTSPRSTRSSSPTPARSTTAPRRPPWSTSRKSLSQEFGPRGIRINAVSPGPVEHRSLARRTRCRRRRSARRWASTPTPRRASVVAGIGGFATGRFTTPEEVADAGRHARLRAGSAT